LWRPGITDVRPPSKVVEERTGGRLTIATRVRKLVFEIDGRNFDSLEGFLGSPEAGFVLRWLHSADSRAALGYDATTRYLAQKLHRCAR
jgi:hypothetical protein